jgi:hypothetical protein
MALVRLWPGSGYQHYRHLPLVSMGLKPTVSQSFGRLILLTLFSTEHKEAVS